MDIFERFEIVKLHDNPNEVLIVIKTCESLFCILDEIESELIKIKFIGIVIMDCLLHSGNNDERYIISQFDGNSLDRSTIKFYHLYQNTPGTKKIKKMSCDVLRKEPDIIECSILTDPQKKMILKGINI